MKTKKEIQDKINKIIEWTIEGYDKLVVKHKCMTKEKFIQQEKEKWDVLADWIKDTGDFKQFKKVEVIKKPITLTFTTKDGKMLKFPGTKIIRKPIKVDFKKVKKKYGK